VTRDDIIRMAREAGLCDEEGYSHSGNMPDIESFANLVAAAERESCAKIADSGADGEDPYCCQPVAYCIAKDIRARGQERQERIKEALDELQADGTLSPAEHRRLINRPWHDKASY